MTKVNAQGSQPRRAGKPPVRRVPSPEGLAQLLARALARAGGGRREVPVALTSLATGVLLLGSGEPVLAASMDFFAVDRSRLEVLAELWRQAVKSAPFLDGHLDALTGWLDDPSDTEAAAAEQCFGELCRVDLPTTVAQPSVDGEILGTTYTFLRSQWDRRSSGAFYTPLAVSRMIAEMNPAQEGDRVLEPACGAGGMVIAAAQVMRAHGHDPATVTWFLNDIDPLAVALAGVNALAHGLGPNVVLACGDGLRLGTGLPGDGLASGLEDPVEN